MTPDDVAQLKLLGAALRARLAETLLTEEMQRILAQLAQIESATGSVTFVSHQQDEPPPYPTKKKPPADPPTDL
jgi:hypothetical protein